ncbi:carbohydrate ABC transporter permease [Halanaerobium sp. ST460_2HS_T2]|uniref:carbohydrate ABC transporter permease n=1 Tax=Halanaerobium sp. ST460_2HS_T2 TaxID=2183914 RepID=UPI000DF3B5B7|nr:carbohydrate ABC transporter permease [Halanaerobium sp. ST460_2HS_T2]RCW50610.1 raffinose/stachyose/melibiose transport system permease protein [Halanaerobium sp. ST460_2HS_T2]
MKKSSILYYIIATIFSIIFGYPFIFMVSTSLKGNMEFLQESIWSLPDTYKFINYLDVLNSGFYQYFYNSIFVTLISLVVLVFISTLASYIITRIDFRMNKFVLATFVAGMMIPIHSTLIPVYKISRFLNLNNKLIGLAGPYIAFMLPVSIFILSGFMESIPKEIEESAFMDGASYFQIYTKIILPLSKPAISTILIYNFVQIWNRFVYGLILISSPEKWILTLGLWRFQGEHGFNVPYVMTALTLASIPLIILFILLQEKVVQGMTAGALKA